MFCLKSTYFTLMCLFLSMCNHMIFEILPLSSLKVTAWFWTLKCITCVDKMVSLQLAFVGSGKSTDITKVIFSCTVGYHVVLESMFPLEPIATHLKNMQTTMITIKMHEHHILNYVFNLYTEKYT